MKYVYLIKSISYPNQTYVGLKKNLNVRLKAHNAGQSLHTAKFKPWRLVTYLAFSHKEKAEKFETYLKTGSGRAFCERHF